VRELHLEDDAVEDDLLLLAVDVRQ
jgi:hypothetical protein